MSLAQIIATDSATEGAPCHNCGLPMSRECVTLNGAGGGRTHNKHYCVSCGLLLGYITRAQLLGWYAGGQGTVDVGALDGYFQRLGVAWG